MKKIIALVLILMMLCAPVAVYAEEWDMSVSTEITDEIHAGDHLSEHDALVFSNGASFNGRSSSKYHFTSILNTNITFILQKSD